MTKFIQFTFSDGTTYEISAEPIADARATYYAEKDAEKGDDYNTVYKEELKYTLENDDEILDWLENNMNWVDVIPFVRKIDFKSKKVDYSEEFCNLKKKIVKK